MLAFWKEQGKISADEPTFVITGEWVYQLHSTVIKTAVSDSQNN